MELSSAVGTVPARLLPELLIHLLTDFRKQKKEQELFPVYAERWGIEYFQKLTAEHAKLPDYTLHPEKYCDWGQEPDFAGSITEETRYNKKMEA